MPTPEDCAALAAEALALTVELDALYDQRDLIDAQITVKEQARDEKIQQWQECESQLP